MYPKKDTVFENLYPSTEKIAKHIAKRGHDGILPTGATVLKKLGLLT